MRTGAVRAVVLRAVLRGRVRGVQLVDAAVLVDQRLGVQEAVGEAALDGHGLADGDELAALAGAAGLDQRPAGRVGQDELVAEDLGDLAVHRRRVVVREAADRDRRHARPGLLRLVRAQTEQQDAGGRGGADGQAQAPQPARTGRGGGGLVEGCDAVDDHVYGLTNRSEPNLNPAVHLRLSRAAYCRSRTG